jgi:general stress protein 26
MSYNGIWEGKAVMHLSNQTRCLVLTTGNESIKAQNIQRDGRVSICVDDQTPPFTFVSIQGNARVMPYKQKEVLKWATKIAERYMGRKMRKHMGKETVA